MFKKNYVSYDEFLKRGTLAEKKKFLVKYKGSHRQSASTANKALANEILKDYKNKLEKYFNKESSSSLRQKAQTRITGDFFKGIAMSDKSNQVKKTAEQRRETPRRGKKRGRDEKEQPGHYKEKKVHVKSEEQIIKAKYEKAMKDYQKQKAVDDEVAKALKKAMSDYNRVKAQEEKAKNKIRLSVPSEFKSKMKQRLKSDTMKRQQQHNKMRELLDLKLRDSEMQAKVHDMEKMKRMLDKKLKSNKYL